MPDNPQTPYLRGPNANIIQGVINFGGRDTLIDDPDEGDLSIYTDYMITNRYEFDKHVYMLGITSPTGFEGDSAAFVQLAAPTLLWIADWTAARFNKQPDIPSSSLLINSSQGVHWTLLDEHIEPVMLTIGADATTPLYRISGTYVYGCRNPNPLLVRNIRFPRPPWLKDIPNRNMPLDYLETNLIT